MIKNWCFLYLCLAATVASAEVKTETVVYQDGETVLEGVMVWDTNKTNASGSKKLPGVLIVHQWLGLTDYEKSRATQLAEMGYVAFALDIYGQKTRPANVQEAGGFAGKYKKDRSLYRKRLQLGLEQLQKSPMVDGSKIAAIGYCFGGTGTLELARSGVPIQGVVSFHGGLDSPTPEDGKKIRSKVLILHGADDPFVPANEIEAMKKEFDAAKVDWQMVYYSGAVHSFTQKMAGNDNSKGAAYNASADKRSWEAMKDFFDEVFAR